MATVTIAAVQAAYILMDQRACVEKAIALLHQAAGSGARIVVLLRGRRQSMPSRRPDPGRLPSPRSPVGCG